MRLKLHLKNKSDLDKSIRTLIKMSCEAVLKEEEFERSAEVSVFLTGAEEVRELNREYREIDKTTDVLSFPHGDENPENGFIMLGDIVINTEKAFEQAREFGHSAEREIAFLTIHSMLHLLGYEHGDEADDKIMREKQTKILHKIGLGVEEK